MARNEGFTYCAGGVDSTRSAWVAAVRGAHAVAAAAVAARVVRGTAAARARGAAGWARGTAGSSSLRAPRPSLRRFRHFFRCYHHPSSGDEKDILLQLKFSFMIISRKFRYCYF